MTDRAARIALFVALIGHAALLLLLSLAWGKQAPREWPKPQSMDVSLVTDVAPEATTPPSPEPPAPSVAPEEGLPQEAPPPAPAAVVKPEPVKPSPPPKPAAVAVVKPLPAPAKPAVRPSRLTGLSRELAAGAKADAAPAKQRGRRLGDNFLAGLAPDAAATKASAAAPGKPGPFPAASIAQAIARQIQPCADRQVTTGMPGANRIASVLAIRLQPDGTLAATPRMVRQTGLDDENERYAQRVVDLGVAAFKGCSPFRLPAEYYSTPSGGWNAINYTWKLR